MDNLQENPNLPLYLNLAAVALALGGCGTMWFARRLWKLAAASKSWPAAPGKILSSTIRQHETSEDATKSVTQYVPEVEYEYVVGGQTLRGTRIKFGGVGRTTNLDKARAKAAAYPVGATIDVFYDPAKPSQCTLDQTISTFGVVLLGLFGLVFVLVAGGMFFLSAIIKAGN